MRGHPSAAVWLGVDSRVRRMGLVMVLVELSMGIRARERAMRALAGLLGGVGLGPLGDGVAGLLGDGVAGLLGDGVAGLLV
jgi:hypothetical protein